MVEETINELVKNVKELVDDNLLSVAQFGSEGEHNNVIIIMESLSFEVLSKLKPVIVEYRKKNGVVPLIFTKEELMEGADVFPLEFLDIKQPHTTVYGAQIVQKIKIHKNHVRTQLEFELRSKLIHLRESYIGIKRSSDLKGLLLSAVPTLMPLFYGLLFLKKVDAPTQLQELFTLVADNYKVDLDILIKINELRENKIKIGDAELDQYISNLIELLTQLVKIVDGM